MISNFFHAGRPENNEFYLCGLIKRTCSLVFYVGLQELSLTLPHSPEMVGPG